ncbi:low molecular weight phosphatase family protein, partial [Roseomonas rosulenta]
MGIGTSRYGAAVLAGLLALLPDVARAQGSDAATIAELRRQLDEMRRRLEQLEARSAPAPAARPARPPPAV